MSERVLNAVKDEEEMDKQKTLGVCFESYNERANKPLSPGGLKKTGEVIWEMIKDLLSLLHKLRLVCK